jgi:hypothetical protein
MISGSYFINGRKEDARKYSLLYIANFSIRNQIMKYFYSMSWGENEPGKVICYFPLHVRSKTKLKDIDMLYPMLYIYYCDL